MSSAKPYNPLEKEHLGESVSDALLRADPDPLGKVPSFKGAGIYAIYYTGNFEPYRTIADRNRDGRFEQPVYVGKAVPPGARKGNVGLDLDPGPALSSRLREHGKSVGQAENIGLEDFSCRFLVVDDIWIPLGESLLIAKFSPVWNKLIDGFGNHDPGSGRYEQERSRWDALHPGRPWALKCKAREETAAQIENELKSFLRAQLD